jgi:hypothetical protein
MLCQLGVKGIIAFCNPLDYVQVWCSAATLRGNQQFDFRLNRLGLPFTHFAEPDVFSFQVVGQEKINSPRRPALAPNLR